jgi:hypothetical protein
MSEMEEQRLDPSKRRFLLKAGLVAAPVIVTLSARPAWAQTAGVASPGGYIKGSPTDLTAPDSTDFFPIDS